MSSTLKALKPVRKDATLAEVENAPAFIRLQACTVGRLSVWIVDVFRFSIIIGLKCFAISLTPNASHSQGNHFCWCEFGLHEK